MGDIVRWAGGGKFLGWYIRYRDVDGQSRQKASHQPTKALAGRMLLEIEARVARGMVGIPEAAPKVEPMSVAALCERFLGEFASPRVKDLGRYRSGARTALNRVLRHIGHLQLSSVRWQPAQDCSLSDFSSPGRRLRPESQRGSLRFRSERAGA